MTKKKFKTKVDVKVKTSNTFNFSGFAYHESYCYDDCGEYYEGWCLTTQKTKKEYSKCSDCENTNEEVDSSVKKAKVNGIGLRMIESILGRHLIEGEYIDAKFIVSVETLDDILLGDNSDPKPT